MQLIYSVSLVTLCRSKVWKGMKVLQPNSIILGTRKLWWIVPIKQKFDITAAFLGNPKCSIWINLTIFLTVFSKASGLHNGQKTIPKFSSGFKHYYYKNKNGIPFHDCERITNFWKYHEKIKEYFNFNKERKTFQLEKGKYFNKKKVKYSN